MKKIFLISYLLLIVVSINAQKVYSVNYKNQADITVYVVEYENQADLKVYKVKYQNQVGKNDGKWFFTQNFTQAKKRIFFVNYPNQADLKIYFVKYENQAGWKNMSKKSLLY